MAGRILPFPTRAGGRLPDERAFLPAALELMETPASPLGRAVAMTICAFFALAVAWACWGEVDVVAIATGKVIPSGRTKTIQPFESGIVRAIRVEEGQPVRAGDVLIELDPTTSAAERDRLAGELLAARLDVARLEAASAGREDRFQPPAGADASVVGLHRLQLLHALAEHRARLGGLERQESQKTGELNTALATIDRLGAVVPILRERVEARKTLSDHEVGSRMAWLELRQDLVDKEKDLAVQRSRLSEAKAALEAAGEARRQAEAEFQRTVLHDLTEVRQKAATLAQELVKAEQRAALQSLTSPVDGTVQQLQVTTLGGVVTPAQPLMSIVPADSRIEVEATLQNKDIGFIAPGQPVEIKVDTFTFTKYGLLHGTVQSLSQDAVPRDRSGQGSAAAAPSANGMPAGPQDLVYTARIALSETQLAVNGHMVNLVPGMAVTAEIKTDTRKIIDYVLSPMLRYRQEVLRER
ncbi:HlyD family type I secretion periplasmic adaptor subunit [Azospirillum sp. A26]|uniref:HlyD family type I secretion periplasmic adaptor subunit n=1 Tax=Azospirillum sp. A26 TaxID=3160607 RepID=UPI003670134F